MKLMSKEILFILFLTLPFVNTYSQEDSIKFALVQPKAEKFNYSIGGSLITDRPDATEASSTVGKGVFHIETGALYTSFEDNNTKSEDFTCRKNFRNNSTLETNSILASTSLVDLTSKPNTFKYFLAISSAVSTEIFDFKTFIKSSLDSMNILVGALLFLIRYFWY